MGQQQKDYLHNPLGMARQDFSRYAGKLQVKADIKAWMQAVYGDFASSLQQQAFSKPLLHHLRFHWRVSGLDVAKESISQDGTVKWLFRLVDGQCIETVFMPEDDRGTLCVSSQVGCAMACRFCATGKMGFTRNLSVHEIIAQLWTANHRLTQLSIPCRRGSRPVSNVVFMGMGEPLLNVHALIKAIEIMTDDWAYGLSKQRVTVSSIGILPALKRLSQSCDVTLAISLHAAFDDLRLRLIPMNKHYPLKDLMQACGQYFPKGSKRKVTFEYVMLDGVNDRDEDIIGLIKLLKGFSCKLNLIPFHASAGMPYHCSSDARMQHFLQQLNMAGIVTTHRKTRGIDIAAACGQLAFQEI
jgi:23S rRNA (adenine2503-C2)-methyltransferase